MLATKLRGEQIEQLIKDEDFGELSGYEAKNTDILKLRGVYDIFHLNQAAIEADFALLTEGRESAPLSETNRVIGPADRLFIEKGATVEWGEYRASVLCQVCHGKGLTGNQPPDPDSPFAPDLRIAQSWGLDAFTRALREGETPSRQLNGAFMPWPEIGHLDDTEIEALYAYIKTL